MKKCKFLAVIFCIGFVFLFNSCRSCSVIPVKGDGVLTVSEKSVTAFDSIRISGNPVVNFHAREEYRVVVTTDSNLAEYAEVFTKNRVLHIGLKKHGFYSFTNFTVDVYCPGISEVAISGSARFEGKDTIVTSKFKTIISGSGKVEGNFECSDFSADISGSGDISGNIKCNRLKIDISGSGKMAVKGNSSDVRIVISGSGDFNGSEFMANSVDARISGSGKVHVWAAENLKARVSGSGLIRYRGTPKIDFKNSGSGRIVSE